MAQSSKQPPRQRMINMMYLVLTAMLALQVSSSIVDKFVFLNQSLEHSLEGAKKASTNALDALRKKVQSEGNSKDGKIAIQRAEALKKETAGLVGYIDKIKKTLIHKAGGGIDPRTGNVKNPKEETKVETYMLGADKGKGKAYELEKKLNAYVTHLYEEFSDLAGIEKPNDMEKEGVFALLAVGNKNNPLYQHDPIQRTKDFAQANFAQTPVVAALAVLTQKQNELIRYEQEIFKRLGIKDVGWLPKFDKIVAMASADARTVASGSDYVAKMFLSASTSHSDVHMAVNGSPIDVRNGLGEVRIPAQGSGEKEWTGEIKLNIRGRDTVFKFTEKYHVVKPVLLVNNKNKFPLYQNCANDLETAVPALGANYQPNFAASNGKVIPGSRVGDVTLVPSRVGNCNLTVRSNGRVVGQQEFSVNPVPPPSMYLTSVNGRTIDPGKTLPNVSQIKVKPAPDPTFQRTLPKEANYQVVKVEVTQFRGGRAVQNKVFPGELINLRSFNPKPGDGFQVTVRQVQRRNFQGKTEPVKPVNTYISFRMR